VFVYYTKRGLVHQHGDGKLYMLLLMCIRWYRRP
jgi:hypothetical protein